MNVASAHLFNARALDPARSVVVQACAGSGKTWLLVSRIVRLLLAGAEPGEVLAITFTRQAAQEMADRLHEWLRFLAQASDDAARDFLSSRALPEAEIDRALSQARGLYERVLVAQPPLTISTFHSWFLQLLRSAPLEAAALGNAALIERTSALLEAAWDRFEESCRRDPQSDAARALDELFERYGLHATRMLLGRFVQRRADWWAYAGRNEDAVARALAQQAAALAFPAGTDVLAALFGDSTFRVEARELAELLARNTNTDKSYAKAIATALGDNAHAQVFQALCRAVLTQSGDPRSRKGSRAQAGRLGASAEARLLELSARLASCVSDAIQAAAEQTSYRANQAGLTAGSALLGHYQEIKQERQVVDFADVEWLAYELLVCEEHAVTMHFKLDSRYRHILLDEFQDTNPLQWLALEAWFAAAVQADSPPGVFMVGDPKQAIFRFRRADARLFEAARDWLRTSHGAAVHSRDESRRCAPPLLDVVNRLFGQEAAFAPFIAHSAYHSALPGRVEVQPLARNPEPSAAAAQSALRDPLRAAREVEEDTRREREAELLVARLGEIVGCWQIVEASGGGRTRLARYGDVMILVRRRTHLEVYERALRHAGMPFLTSRQGGLLDTLEAADLMALLEFLISPFDDLKLAQALRSPLFGCSEDDLARVVQGTGRSWWERLQALPDAALGDRLRHARALLACWLDCADRLPVHDTLDRIYFEGDVLRRYELAVPEPMRAAVAANLDAFIQRALDVDSGRYPSLPRFLSELRDMLGAPAEEAPDEGEVACGADAIRIMTVHGAKGLEAPIVWILDATATRPPERGFDVLVQWQPGEPAPTSFSLVTRSAERSRTQCRQFEIEARYAEREELNLLYVAMTRARQALIVSGCEPRSTPGSWYARVRSAVDAAAGHVALPELPAVHGDPLERRAQDARLVARAAGSPIDRQEAKPASRASFSHAQLELEFDPAAASAAGQAAGADPTRRDDASGTFGALAAASLYPVGRRRDTLASRAQRYGVAFHVLMQHATDANPHDLAELAQRLGRPPAEVAPMWAQACRLMAEPDLARFFDAARFERALNEWPIVTAAGELRRVDRMVEFSGEVWVLDYKTGSRAAVADSALEVEYRAQVQDYCIALRAVFPAKRVSGLILFADGSRIAIEPPASAPS